MTTTYFYSFAIRCHQNNRLVGCNDGILEFDGVPDTVQFKVFVQQQFNQALQDNGLPALDWNQYYLHLLAFNPIN